MITKKLRKIIAVSLAAISMIGALAACGGKDAAEDGVTVVRWWTNDGGGSAVWQDMINEYNNTIGKEENIKIDYKLYSDSYTEVLETAFESKQVAELVTLVGDTKVRIAKGQVKPFNDLPGWENVNEEWADYLKEGKNFFDGKVYTLPYNVTTYGLIYNTDMFEAAGIVDENGKAKPPVTWDEFVEVAKKLTDTSKNQYGVMLPMKWGGYWYYEGRGPAQTSSATGDVDRTTMEADYSCYIPWMEALCKIKADGSYFPGPEGMDNDPARAQFATGNIGMKFGASWDVGVLTDQFPAECNWDIAPFPVVNANERYRQFGEWGSITGVSNYIEEDKLEAVGKVLKWMYSDEVAVRLYEEEINIPIRPGIAEKANVENVSPAWQSSQKLVEITNFFRGEYAPLPTDLKVKTNVSVDTVLKQCWADGNTDNLAAELEKCEKDYNEALKAAFTELGVDINEYKLEPGYRKTVTWEY